VSEVLARRDKLLSDPKRQARIAAAEAKRERVRLEQAQALAVRNATRIEDFRAGKPNVGHVSDADGCAMLRLSADKLSVQTSWGASAPVSDVQRVLRFYDLMRYQAPRDKLYIDKSKGIDSASYTLGSFRLDTINADGSVKVGCHTIIAREIELLRLDMCAETSAA
jgi:hypothetical protein